MSRQRSAALLCAIATVITAGAVAPAAAQQSRAAACPLPVFGPGKGYRPSIRPHEFTPRVTNEWFPLTAGTTLVYSGTKDGKAALDVVHTSRHTAVIDRVVTRIVEDRLYLDGRLEERTSDYYAQDRCGNVWYFGEDTATLNARGTVVSTEGSFHAGVDGAQPGVFMQVHPQLGRRFRQEWYAGQAEDTFRAVQRSTRVTVPYGRFRHALRTDERTALEPDVLDNKYYVAGIGEVVEVAVRGPAEKLVLVDVLS